MIRGGRSPSPASGHGSDDEGLTEEERLDRQVRVLFGVFARETC